MKKSLILLTGLATMFCQAQKIVETIKGEFKFPEGVAIDSKDNVYISDTQNSKIKMWNSVTKKVETIVENGIDFPQHMVTDPATGIIYFGDLYNNQIKKINPETKEVTTLNENINWEKPASIALDKNGNLYYTDYYFKGIKKYNLNTQEFQ